MASRQEGPATYPLPASSAMRLVLSKKREEGEGHGSSPN